MKVTEINRWIHRLIASATLMSLFTGSLFLFPDLRALLVGGQSKYLSDIHLYTGILFVSAPLLALLFQGSGVVKRLLQRVWYARNKQWRRVHLSVSLLSCFMMGLTGVFIWIDSLWVLPVTLLDIAFVLHQGFAWSLGLVLPMHLWMARRGIVRTAGNWSAGLASAISNSVPVQSNQLPDRESV